MEPRSLGDFNLIYDSPSVVWLVGKQKGQQMKPLVKVAVYAALVALVALPAVSVNAVAKDHDHEWADRDNDRDGDHDNGMKNYSGEALKRLSGADSDRGSTGAASGASGGHVSGVPGPLVGAGLPVLAVGYGAYWLIRRYRRKPN
jgi:hypothetical protein